MRYTKSQRNMCTPILFQTEQSKYDSLHTTHRGVYVPAGVWICHWQRKSWVFSLTSDLQLKFLNSNCCFLLLLCCPEFLVTQYTDTLIYKIHTIGCLQERNITLVKNKNVIDNLLSSVMLQELKHARPFPLPL
jgi:hypothetical protein